MSINEDKRNEGREASQPTEVTIGKILSHPKQKLVNAISSMGTGEERQPTEYERADTTKPEPIPVQEDTTTEDMTDAAADRFAFDSVYSSASAGKRNQGREESVGDIYKPAWSTSYFSELIDDGFVANSARLIQDVYTSDQIGTEVDEVLSSEDMLMHGIEDKDKYRWQVLSTGSMEHSKRMRDNIIRIETNNKLRANEGLFQSFTAGAAAFLTDLPTVAMTGGVAGLTAMTAKLIGKLTAKAGIKQTGKTKVVGSVATLAVSGAIEEGIRLAPRVAHDPTYTYENYKNDVIIGSVFAGGIGALVPGLKVSGRKAFKTADKVSSATADILRKYKVDVAGRTIGNMAADIGQTVKTSGIKKTVSDFDKTAKFREARDKANTTINNQLREVDVETITQPLREANTKGATDTTVVSDTVNDAVDQVIEAAEKRVPEAKQEAFKEAVDTLKTELGKLSLFKKDIEGAKKDEPSAMDDTGDDLNTAHSDIDASRKKMEEFVNKIEDPEVRKSAQAKLDDILRASQEAIRNVADRRGVEIKRTVADNIDDAVETRVNEGLSTEELTELADTIGLGNTTLSRIIDRVIRKIDPTYQPRIYETVDELVDDIRTNPEKALKKIAESHNRLAPIAHRLAGQLRGKTTVRVLDWNDLKDVSSSDKAWLMKAQAEGREIGGFVSADGKFMGIFPNRMDGTPRQAGTLAEIFVHESLHAATNGKLHADPKTLKPHETVAIQSLNDSLATAKAWKDTDAYNNLSDKEKVAFDLATTNVNELVAYGMSGKKAQSVLKQIKSESTNTVWSKFTQALAKLFDADETLLRDVIQASDELIDAQAKSPFTDPTQSFGQQINNLLRQHDSDPAKQLEILSGLQGGVSQAVKDIAYEADGIPTARTAEEHSKIQEALLAFQDKFDSVIDHAGLMRAFPYEDTINMRPKWATVSAAYEQSTGDARAEVHAAYDSMVQQGLSNTFGRLTHSMSSRMMRSKVPLAEWFAQNVFELPVGTGGKITRNDTAAVLSRMWDQAFIYEIDKAWEVMMKEAAKDQGLPWFKVGALTKSSPNQHRGAEAIARKVQAEMNSRQMGRDSTQPEYIKEFANTLEKVNSGLYDLQAKHRVDGITGDNKMKHYMQQVWKDGKLAEMIDDPSIGKANMTTLFSESLRSRNPKLSVKAANEFAQIIIKQKMLARNQRKSEGFNLTESTREGEGASITELMSSLEKTLAKDPNRDELLKEIRQTIEDNDTGGPGYTHRRRINLDLEAEIQVNGNTISMLDLMDNDVASHATRYSKTATGMAAMSKATGGLIRSDADMDDFLVAMANQASEMGSHVNTKDVRNSYRAMIGGEYDGQLPMDVRKIRDAVALAGMNGLGESQLAELGLAVNRGTAGLVGALQYASGRHGSAKKLVGLQLTDAQANDKAFLDDLQELTGMFEDMHIVERRNVHFDAAENQQDMNFMQQMLDMGTGGKYRPYMQYMQSRYTGYGVLRTMEEQIAMAGLLQDFAKFIDIRRDSFSTKERLADIGLVDAQGNSKFSKYWDDGTVVMENGRIKALNLHEWSDADKDSLGVALRRHAGQQVQQGYAGELSPGMTNPMIAFLMQFKSYPVMAAEKQQARNMMFQKGLKPDKELSMGILLNGITSGMARSIRYQSLAMALAPEDREAYLNRKHNDMAYNSFEYMGIAGMFPQINEHMGRVGLPSFHENTSYGDDGISSIVPAVSWAENYTEGMRSTSNILTGGGTERDLSNIATAAPLGTILQTNMLVGALKQLMTEDGE